MRVQKHLDDFHRYKQSEKQLMVIDIAKYTYTSKYVFANEMLCDWGGDAYGVYSE